MVIGDKTYMALCSHCGEALPQYAVCGVCDRTALSLHECMECHSELRHGIIVNTGSIHICGNGYSGLNSVDKDWDAYKRSGR